MGIQAWGPTLLQTHRMMPKEKMTQLRHVP